MSTTRIEKVFGRRTVREDSRGYLSVAIPPEAGEEDRLNIEPGEEVRIVGVIDGSENRLEIQRADGGD